MSDHAHTRAYLLRNRSYWRRFGIGAHPGDRLDYWSEGGDVTLPNSRLDMHYADGLHHYSDAPIPAGAQEHLHLDIDAKDLEPDVMVDGTWREYSSGADPVSAAVTGGPLRCTDD